MRRCSDALGPRKILHGHASHRRAFHGHMCVPDMRHLMRTYLIYRDVSGRTIGGLIGGAHNSVVASWGVQVGLLQLFPSKFV
jgi:hypothetical protein